MVKLGVLMVENSTFSGLTFLCATDIVRDEFAIMWVMRFIALLAWI